MNGGHDLGGVHGLGRVEVEKNEPYFHSNWERRVFGIVWATFGTGLYNLDEFRHGIERLNPIDYLSSRYYEHWLHTVEKNLVDKGILTEKEIEAKTKHFLENPDAPVPRREDPEKAEAMAKAAYLGAPTHGQTDAKPRFNVGDKVVTVNKNPVGHTRLARYVRGKRGVVNHVYGAYIFPDTNAHGQGQNPQYVYSVRFDGRELWGETAEKNQILYFDLWENYLRPA